MTNQTEEKPNKLLLTNVRLSFPNLFAPKVSTNDSGAVTSKYGASFILDPKDPQVEKIKKVMKEVAIDKWGNTKGAEMYKVLTAGDKVCLRNGDAKAQYPGFAGNMYVSTNATAKPHVVDSDKKTVLTPQDGRPYAGCFVHASIEIWAQDNKNGKRINAGVIAVMFAKHAEPFAGGSTADGTEFDSIEAEEDSEFA